MNPSVSLMSESSASIISRHQSSASQAPSTRQATASTFDDFVSKFQTTKISWRGKYDRIFALAPTGFCTIDPKDFDVTNTWPFSSLINVLTDPEDPEGFTLVLAGTKKNDELKLRCKYRSHLLSELFRLKEAANASSLGLPRPIQSQRTNLSFMGGSFHCQKLSRRNFQTECILDIMADAVVYRKLDGVLLTRYPYTNIDHVTAISDHEEAFVLGYTGRGRLFFCPEREKVLKQIEAATQLIGLELKIRREAPITLGAFKTTRKQYGVESEAGKMLVSFKVKKLTRKHKDAIPRILELNENCLLERDISDSSVVSLRPWSTLFCLVRPQKKPSRLEIEYIDGEKRSYISNDREGLLAALFDMCLSAGNDEITINFTPSHHGLRLLPRFAKEDPSESSMFFGDASIGSCLLKRIAAVGKWTSGGGHGRGLVYIAEEFNANVPASGIQRNTKKHYITDALKPLIMQLCSVSLSDPPAPRMAVTLLQSLYRIAPSYYGMREILSFNGIVDAIKRFLKAEDELTVFWIVMLIRSLTKNIKGLLGRTNDRERDVEGESRNKRILFQNGSLISSFVDLLNGVDVGVVPNEAGETRVANAVDGRQRRVGPVVLMVVMDTLEGALCSCRDSTNPSDHQFLLGLVCQHYSKLLRLLFCSKSATTVEACTLMVKTILEECEPAMAMSIKNAALTEGIVLRHLYLSMFDADMNQRLVSRYLISLWMTDHSVAKKLMLRVFPAGLVRLLKEPRLSRQDIERLDLEEEDELRRTRILSETSFSEAHSSFSDQGKLTQTQKPATIVESYVADADSAENNSCTSMDKLSPRAISEAETDDMSKPLPKYSENSLRAPSNRLRRKMNESTSSSTANAQHFPELGDAPDIAPPALLMAPSTRGFLTRIVHRQSLDNTTRTPTKKTRPGKGVENFELFFHRAREDHVLPDLIWNEETRAELKAGLCAALDSFEQVQEQKSSKEMILWNVDEFRIEYRSLSKEVCIGKRYYLRVLILRLLQLAGHGEGNLDNSNPQQDAQIIGAEENIAKYIDNPSELMLDLYHQVLKERGDAEFLAKIDHSLDCLLAMGLLYKLARSQIGAFQDMNYVAEMIRRTVHSKMLMYLLEVLLQLAHNRENAHMLVNERDLTLMVDLLCLGHISHRQGTRNSGREDNVPQNLAASSKPVWFVKVNDAEEWEGPFLTSDLVHHYATQCLVRSSVDVPGQRSEGRAIISDNTQLRWEMGLSDVLDYDQISSSALRVILFTLRSIQIVSQFPSTSDQKDSISAVSSVDVFPIPDSISILSMEPNLCYIAQSMLLCDTAMNEGSAEALTLLTRMNFQPQARGQLFHTGVFYFIWTYTGTAFELFASVLRINHLHQAHYIERTTWRSSRDLVNKEYSQEIARGDGIMDLVELASNETYHKEYEGSILYRLLPAAMIHVLTQHGERQFAEVFQDYIETPEVVWTPNMREYLCHRITEHLDSFPSEVHENVQCLYQYLPIPTIEYEELETDFYCHHFYLGRLCNEDKFPSWPIEDAPDFMHSLLKSWIEEVERKEVPMTPQAALKVLRLISDNASTQEPEEQEDIIEDISLSSIRGAYRKCIQDSILSVCPDAFRAQSVGLSVIEKFHEYEMAYTVLSTARQDLVTKGSDPVHVLLIMRSMILLCKRYPQQLGPYQFHGYVLVLNVLRSHTEIDELRHDEQDADLLHQLLELLVVAAELVFMTCLVSPTNGDQLIIEDGVEVLLSILHHCVMTMCHHPPTISDEAKNHREVHGNDYLSIMSFTMQTMAGLIASSQARELVAGSPWFTTDLCLILQSHLLAPHMLLTQYTLESISRMCQLPQLQLNLLQSGVLWHLIGIVRDYSKEEHKSQDDEAGTETESTAPSSSTEQHESTSAPKFDTGKCDHKVLSLMAVRALSRLGGYLSDDLASPECLRAKYAINVLFTPEVAATLQHPTGSEFLSVLMLQEKGTLDQSILQWNVSMQNELDEFVETQSKKWLHQVNLELEKPNDASAKIFFKEEEALSFRYKALEHTLQIGGVYIETLWRLLKHDMDIDESFSRRSATENSSSQSGSLQDELAVLPTDFYSSLLEWIQRDGTYQAPPTDDPFFSSCSLPIAGWGFESKSEELALRHCVLGMETLEMLAKMEPSYIEHALSTATFAIGGYDGFEFVLSNLLHDGMLNAAMDPHWTIAKKPRDHLVLMRNSALKLILHLSTRPYTAERIARMKLLGKLLQLVSDQLRHSPEDTMIRDKVFEILVKLCQTRAIVDHILMTRCFYELIAWFIQIEEVVTDAEFAAAESVRPLACRVLVELAALPTCAQTVGDALARLFPIAIRDQLVDDAENAVEFFETDHSTPELIWNLRARNHLREAVQARMETVESRGIGLDDVIVDAQTFQVRWDTMGFPFCVGNVYLSLYLQQPTYHLRYPRYFMGALFYEFTALCSAQIEKLACEAIRSTEEEDLLAKGEDPLTLVTSSLICLFRVHPQLAEQSSECMEFVQRLGASLQSCNGLVDGGNPQLSCLRLVHLLGSFQPLVAAFVKLNILQLLMSPHRPGSSALHPEAAMILDSMRWIILLYPPSPESAVDSKDDQTLAAIAVQLGLPMYLLEIIQSTRPGMNSVRDPEATRAIAIATLRALEESPRHGELVTKALRKQKVWEKNFKHENVSGVLKRWSEQGDIFFHGPAANAEEQLRNHAKAAQGQRMQQQQPFGVRSEGSERRYSNASRTTTEVLNTSPPPPSRRRSKTVDFKRLFR